MMKKRKIKFRSAIAAGYVWSIQASIYISKRTSLNCRHSKKFAGSLSEAQTQLNRLKHKSEYMGTSKYIENTAREKLGLVYEDELIITTQE